MKKFFIANFLICFFVFSVFKTLGQVNLKCCGLNLSITHFVETEKNIYYPSILTEKKILPAFHELKTPFALRIIYSPLLATTILDFQYVGGQFLLTEYQIITDFPKSFNDSSYVDIGPHKRTTNFLHKTSSHLVNVKKWEENLKGLIQNHLFDLESDPEFGKKMETFYPNVEFEGDAGSTSIQIKVADHFRSIYYSGNYHSLNGRPQEVTYYNNIANILKKLSQDYKQ